MSNEGTPNNPIPIVLSELDEEAFNIFARNYLIRSRQHRQSDMPTDMVRFQQWIARYQEENNGASPPDALRQAEYERLTPEGSPKVPRMAYAGSPILEVPRNGYGSSRPGGFEEKYQRSAFLEQYFLGYDNSAIGKFHGHNSTGGSFRMTPGASLEFADQVRARQQAGDDPQDVIKFLDILAASASTVKIMYAGKVMGGLHPGFKKPIFGTDPSTNGLTREDFKAQGGLNPRNRFDTIIRRLPRANEFSPGGRRLYDEDWPPGTFSTDGVLNPILAPYAGKWVAISYFTERQFLDLRDQLIAWTAEAGAEYGAGKFLDTARGGWTTREAIEANLEKVANKIGKTTRPPKPEEPDYEALFRLRLENAQALLITAMPDMMQVNGIRPILRKAEDLSRKRNGTSRSDYPDRKLLNKIAPECLNLYDGEPQALVDLISNPGGTDAFLCATPAELGYLQPRLQFYINDRPVEFPDHSDGDLIKDLAKAKASNAQSIKNIFRARGTVGTDVGIKNFSWRYENKHEGDSRLKASLTLYFGSSIELLNDEYLSFIFDSNAGAARPKNKSTSASKEQELTAKDLEKLSGQIASRVAVLKNPKTDFFAGDSPYGADLIEAEAKGIRRPAAPPQLTLQAGWAVPEGVEHELSPAFLSGVKRSQRLINLRMYQYQVEFGEQGQLHLTLDYVGGVDEFLGQPDKSNVFDSAIDLGVLHSRAHQVSTGLRLTKQSQGGITDIAGYFQEDSYKKVPIAGEPQLRSMAWPSGYISRQVSDSRNITMDSRTKIQRVTLSLGGVLYEIKTLKLMKEELIGRGLKEGMDKMLRQIDQWIDVATGVAAEIRSSHSDLIYSGFVKNLLSSGKLYYATVNSEAVNGLGPGFPGQQSVGAGQERGKITLGTNYNFVSGIPTGWRVDVRGGRPASVAGASSMGRKFQNAVNHTSASGGDTAGAAYLDPTTPGFCPEPGVDEKSTVLYYMKLGDILDLVLCGLKDRPFSPNVEYILGSFYPYLYRIPGTKPGDIYSLKDIPISMDYFGDWFMRSFLTKRTTPKVSFQQFMKELMSGLVANLFNRILRPSESKNFGLMVFDSTSIASPINIPTASTRSPSLGRLVGTNDLKALVSQKGDQSWSRLGQREYFLMYVKQLNPELVGNRQQDLARGIYHLTLGADRGLVKRFNFSQLDIPYYKEMMIEQGNFAQGVFMAQNVDITMVGNTLFRNGQTVYVNADFGLGAAAHKLGIGGYYTVTRVENYIESGKFETRIKCTFIKRKAG